MKPLNSFLFEAVEKCCDRGIKNKDAVRMALIVITNHYASKNGNIDGYEEVINMLLDEFYCEIEVTK